MSRRIVLKHFLHAGSIPAISTKVYLQRDLPRSGGQKGPSRVLSLILGWGRNAGGFQTGGFRKFGDHKIRNKKLNKSIIYAILIL